MTALAGARVNFFSDEGGGENRGGGISHIFCVIFIIYICIIMIFFMC